jgi:hypothetical protein
MQIRLLTLSKLYLTKVISKPVVIGMEEIG